MNNPFLSIENRLEKIELMLLGIQGNCLTSHQEIDNQNDELLTRKQVLELLKISSPTLWRWEKLEKVKSYSICGKRYYKHTEIIESLKKVKS